MRLNEVAGMQLAGQLKAIVRNHVEKNFNRYQPDNGSIFADYKDYNGLTKKMQAIITKYLRAKYKKPIKFILRFDREIWNPEGGWDSLDVNAMAFPWKGMYIIQLVGFAGMFYTDELGQYSSFQDYLNKSNIIDTFQIPTIIHELEHIEQFIKRNITSYEDMKKIAISTADFADLPPENPTPKDWESGQMDLETLEKMVAWRNDPRNQSRENVLGKLKYLMMHQEIDAYTTGMAAQLLMSHSKEEAMEKLRTTLNMDWKATIDALDEMQANPSEKDWNEFLTFKWNLFDKFLRLPAEQKTDDIKMKVMKTYRNLLKKIYLKVSKFQPKGKR